MTVSLDKQPVRTGVDWCRPGESVVPKARRAEFVRKMREQVWHEPEGNHPFSPAHALMAVIEEFGIKPVMGIGYSPAWTAPDGPETATYTVLGVKTRKQHIAFVDQGWRVVPVAILDLEGEELA